MEPLIQLTILTFLFFISAMFGQNSRTQEILKSYNTDSEIMMHDGKPISPNPDILIYFSIKMARGGLKSIDFGIAVVLAFVFF